MLNESRKYKVVYTVEQEVEFDDAEMREFGYEGIITNEMREEYLQQLLADEYDIDEYVMGNADRKIIRVE